MKIVLTQMPIPISVNKSLTMARGRFIKTKDSRIYDAEFNKWIFNHTKELVDARRELSLKWLAGERELSISLYYCFPREKLITKANTLRKLDVDNRAKSAIDHITRAIGQDDCFIIKNTNEKCISLNGKEELIAIIELFKLRNKEDIFK